MKSKSTRQTSAGGYSLVELLVYMAVLVVLIGVGYAALYFSMSSSAALRRSGDDIANALRAGEGWRADVRAAGGQIKLETTVDEQIIHLPGPRGEIGYRFATNTIFRRNGNNEWSPFLSNVKASTFISDSRHNAAVWRWELELQPRAKTLGTIRPLFTFLAVPTGDLPR